MCGTSEVTFKIIFSGNNVGYVVVEFITFGPGASEGDDDYGGWRKEISAHDSDSIIKELTDK